MNVGNSLDCYTAILGAGPYGLSAAAYLRAAGIEARAFGQPMSFWQNQMPKGMCLRSSWDASHIADPKHELTLDEYCRQNGNRFGKPIPLNNFVAYGQWFQQKAVPDLDRRGINLIERDPAGFKLSLSDGSTLRTRRVVVAAGIKAFVSRPAEFDGIPAALVSHACDHDDLGKFKGQSVIVIGSGQSALESAALLQENGAAVEVISRRDSLRWVGAHPKLHHLGAISKMLYSKRDVGPAGISRLVAAPHLFRRLPRSIQNRTAYRAIRPAVAFWLHARIANVQVTFGRRVASAEVAGSRLRLKLDDGSERMVDHVLLATGYRVDVTRYDFLAPEIVKSLKTVNGFPILKRGLETSVPGLHIVGKPAAWSFGPILGFVSGAEFAATELVGGLSRANGSNGKKA